LAEGNVILRTRACGHSLLQISPTPDRAFVFYFFKTLSLLHRTSPLLHRFSISPKRPQTQTPLRAFFPHTHRAAPHAPHLHVFAPSGPETPNPLPARPSPSPAPAPSHTSGTIFLFWKRLSCTATPLDFPSPHNTDTKPASDNHRPAQPHTSGGRDPATAAVHNPCRSTHSSAPPLGIPYRSTNTLPHPNPVPASLSKPQNPFVGETLTLETAAMFFVGQSRNPCPQSQIPNFIT